MGVPGITPGSIDQVDEHVAELLADGRPRRPVTDAVFASEPEDLTVRHPRTAARSSTSRHRCRSASLQVRVAAGTAPNERTRPIGTAHRSGCAGARRCVRYGDPGPCGLLLQVASRSALSGVVRGVGLL